MTVFDPRAPMTVRAAAVMLAAGAIFLFLENLGLFHPLLPGSADARFRPVPQVIGLIAALWDAWLLGRLNGLLYWGNIAVFSAIGLILLIFSVLRLFGVSLDAGPREPPGAFTWILIAYLLTLVALFFAKPSLRAPWGMWSGFPEPRGKQQGQRLD